MRKAQGVYTAIVTPFDEMGRLDEEGLRQNIRFQIANSVDGIVALGTTGECPTLSSQERERVIRISVDEVKGKVLLMVGTGSYATQQTIENTRQAALLGADMALIVSPYYNKPTQEGLFRHYKAVAEATPLPIIVYNIQGRTGQNIQNETLKRLADLPTIIGVKEASGNITQIGEVIEMIAKHKPGFSVLSGDDALTLPIMALGGDGVISVISNLLPDQVKSLVLSIVQGNWIEAREIHYRLMPVIRAMFMETNPIPIKAAMNFFGMASGPCRLPLCEMLPENEKKLRALLKNIQIPLASTSCASI